MRVVAGEHRGRLIEAPPGRDTRPTTDKVREAVFNALGSLDLVRDAVVADLYAGSGALGIEALSRGAHEAVFVERDRAALRVLRDNLSTLGLDGRARVMQGDALALASRVSADLVLADPPYDFERWDDLLARIGAPFVVTESGRTIESMADLDELGFRVIRSKRYSRTWIAFLERIDPDATPPN